MQNLYALLQNNGNLLNYQTLHRDKTIQKIVYEAIRIHHAQSPFDYVDSLWVNDDETVCLTAFIEPVGNTTFKGPDLAQLFTGINQLFNAQPAAMCYAEAGHKIAHYARHIRKNFGMDVRYLDINVLWELELNEEIVSPPSVERIQTGHDLFHYVKAKNRLPVGIIDSIYFYGTGLEDGMMGEIIHVEEQMPDFFKVIIDLTRFHAHNQRFFAMNEVPNNYRLTYPSNQLAEVYFAYNETFTETDIVQLLRKEDIKMFQEEAEAYWLTEMDTDFEVYRKK